MKLRIYFSGAWHDSNSPCLWALCDVSGAAIQSGESALASLPKADDYIAIISATRLLCVNVQMPVRSRRRWEAALPFVAEEYTLSAPEENHVVPGIAQKDGQRTLFIVDKGWLKAIIAACDTAGIRLRRVLPEMLLPALPRDSWVVVWDGDKGFIRTGATSGTALDQGDAQHAPLTLMLRLNAALSAPPQHILIRSVAHTGAIESVLPHWEGLPAPLTASAPWDWRQEAIPDDTLNLLWGPLAPPARWDAWLPVLRPVALMLCMVILIETLGIHVQWGMLSHEKTAVTREMERTFRQTFGDASVVVDPALQMQRNIAVLRHNAGLPDEGDFLPLLDQAAAALAPLPESSIKAMRYVSGRLDIDLTLPSATEMSAMQQRVNGKGLSLRFGDIRATGSGIEARVSIQTGGLL